MSDQGQKTEKPTPQRIRKAREEGRFAISKEFVFAAQFLVFVSLLSSKGGDWWDAQARIAKHWLEVSSVPELSVVLVTAEFRSYAFDLLTPVVLAGVLLFGTGLAVQLGLTSFGLASNRLTPDITRLNPMSRLKDMPKQNLTSLVQAAVLLPLLSAILWGVAIDQAGIFLSMPFMPLRQSMSLTSSTLLDLLWKAAALFVAWGSIDLFRQKRKYTRELMMSKQEIREEMKQSDGNPEVKMRIRRLRRDLLRRKMMSEVPKATAVIVNPTHFAVAIRYTVQDMTAPKVVAKGKNYLALRIRQKALDHQIPVIENPPLARALYKSVDVGQEIPPHLYRAVAEILAYIYKIMNGRLPGA